MYAQDYDSLLIDGTCQIPNPAYRVIGSIVSFYIPLIVMLVTYWLTVRLLDVQRKNLVTPQPNGWSTSGGWTSSSSTSKYARVQLILDGRVFFHTFFLFLYRQQDEGHQSVNIRGKNSKYIAAIRPKGNPTGRAVPTRLRWRVTTRLYKFTRLYRRPRRRHAISILLRSLPQIQTTRR